MLAKIGFFLKESKNGVFFAKCRPQQVCLPNAGQAGLRKHVIPLGSAGLRKHVFPLGSAGLNRYVIPTLDRAVAWEHVIPTLDCARAGIYAF